MGTAFSVGAAQIDNAANFGDAARAIAQMRMSSGAKTARGAQRYYNLIRGFSAFSRGSGAMGLRLLQTSFSSSGSETPSLGRRQEAETGHASASDGTKLSLVRRDAERAPFTSADHGGHEHATYG